jgi:hypothetical protein
MTAAQKPGSPDLQPPGAELTILPRRAGRKEALPLLVHMIGAADRHQVPYPLTCKLDIRQRAAGLGEIAGERSTFAIQPRSPRNSCHSPMTICSNSPDYPRPNWSRGKNHELAMVSAKCLYGVILRSCRTETRIRYCLFGISEPCLLPHA